MADKVGFTFLLWNGKYGEQAKFIVRDNSTQKLSYFTPGDMDGISWTNSDLTKDSTVAGWDGFEDETVDDLEDVVF
ncbi:hypothetical protein D3C74_50580 [compost metagenome]